MHDELREAVRDLCRKYPETYWQRHDRAKSYPIEFVTNLTASGYLACLIPEEYGGSGLGIAEAAVIMEEINRSGANSAACHAQMYTMGTVLRHGSDEQKRRWLPAIAAGELRLQAFAVTEADAGSDTTRTATFAERRGDRYVVSGRKVFISRVQHSDLMVLLARTTRIEDAHEVATRLSRQALGFPYEARDWMQMNRNVFIALRLEKLVYFLVLSLMLVVAGFSILATLIMVVMEKRKDIAILKSMGATDGSIARIFVLKGLVIGLVGTVLGNAGGLAISWLISKYKLPLPHGVFFTQTVPVVIVPEYFAAVTGAAFVVCLLVTLYPASRAARVAPVDVIRYE